MTGRIQTRSYENQQGQRVYVTEVVVENFQLLESRSTNQQHKNNDLNNFNGQGASNKNNNESAGDPFGGSSIDVSDDLPF